MFQALALFNRDPCISGPQAVPNHLCSCFWTHQNSTKQKGRQTCPMPSRTTYLRRKLLTFCTSKVLLYPRPLSYHNRPRRLSKHARIPGLVWRKDDLRHCLLWIKETTTWTRRHRQLANLSSGVLKSWKLLVVIPPAPSSFASKLQNTSIPFIHFKL